MRDCIRLTVFITWVWLSSLLSVSFGQTQQPYFKHLTRDAGLSSNKINCITQDKFGFIWVGTEDGICRYDGVRFKIYKTEHGLPDNYVNSVACDERNGNLWIGTRQGLSFFNRKEERFYNNFLKIASSDGSIFSSSIYKVFLDSKKRLWLGTGHGLFYFNKAVFNYSKPALKGIQILSKKEVINDVFEDSKHRVWIGSKYSLKIYDPEKKILTSFRLSDKKINVREISEDSRRNIWISTGNLGVYQLNPDGKLLNNFKKGSALFTNNVTGVVDDGHGNVWIGAKDGGGLFTFDHKNQKVEFLSGHTNVPEDPNSITSNAITAIYRDRKGYIWVGTYAGLNYYDPYRKNFMHYKVNFKPGGIFNSNVRCFYQDQDGQIWVGTRDEGGISKFNPQKGTFVNYPSDSKSSSGLTDGNVLTLTDLGRDKLLVGTNNSGLFVFNKKTGNFSHLDAPDSDPFVSRGRIGMVSTDQYGKVWVASPEAVYTLDPETYKLHYEVKMASVREMLEYNKDEVYFASLFDGFYHYNRTTGKLIHYLSNDDANSLSNNRINSICKDKNGRLWIATNNGLNLFDPHTKKFKVYTTEQGLPTNIICGILTDEQGNLWLSTVNGLVKFSPYTGLINVFNIHDGLQGNEFEKGVCLSARDGAMLFGGINGFNYFHPQDITANPLVPTVVLTDLKIFNKPVSIDSKDSPLTQSIGFVKEITLKHNQSFLEFEFAGLSFTSPENNQYAYKLEGLENDWNVSGNKTSASYTGLQPGNYVLHVKASNNDGVWSKEELVLKLEVLPPWWQTITFQLLVIFALIGAVVWFYYYRTRSLRTQKRKLDLLVKERTEVIRLQNKELEKNRDEVMKLNSQIKAISEYRLQFFTNISHEFRTPLTLIIGPLNKLLSKKAEPKEMEENLQIMKRNAGRLLHLINELMDFRSLENRNMPLKVKQINLNGLVDEIAGLFVELAREKQIDFDIEHAGDLVEGWIDSTKLQKIIFNLISNAFNYTHKGGRISVSTSLSDGCNRQKDAETFYGKAVIGSRYYEIKVKDTGVGIPEESLSKVFKQFYRESITNIDTKGTGLGLSIVKELIRIHKGVISVRSKVGEGSEFTVKIPIDRNIYSSDIEESSDVLNFIYDKTQVSDLLGYGADETVEHAIKTNEKGREHVLIVEDNEELLNFITRQLSPNYKVTQARNGMDGLSAAMKYTPDVVISDVVMPIMTGVELLKKLKENAKTAHIPVVLLTARADIESQLVGIEAGADDYISKPFDIDVFKLKVRNLIQSRIMLRKLFSTSSDDIPVEADLNNQDAVFLEKVISIIRANISNEDFGVNQLVDQMCVSSSLLQKKISKLTNHTPTEFITLHRMKKALELIQRPGATVAEVSEQVGFKDPYYFSRCFKKQFGKSPKVFVESLQGSEN